LVLVVFVKVRHKNLDGRNNKNTAGMQFTRAFR
jgi:hypothetical protein